MTNQYQYDSLNRLTNLVWNLNVSTLAKFSYQLGATGSRTNLNETVGGTNRLYTWQYDQLYRLTNENESSLISPSGNLAYQYDPVGNRLARQSTISQLPTTGYSYGTNDWLSTDKYDLNGNTTNSGSVVYQYDAMNHLTNANGIVMTYDGDGNRVSKTVGVATIYYLVDDQNPSGYSQILEEYRGTALTNVYNYGSSLISQRTPHISTNYFISDGHGSTRMLTDNSGTVVNVMVYDSYGDLIASNGFLQTAYLYSGQQFDSDLGLYLNRARYLNTGTGRFWTMDSTEGENEDPLSLHKYLYTADDPVNMVDPSGNDYGAFEISMNAVYIPLALLGANVAPYIAGSATVDVHFDYLGTTPFLGKKYYHAYLLLHGPGGLTYIFRGGPSDKYHGGHNSGIIKDYSFLQPHGADMGFGYLTDAGSGELFRSSSGVEGTPGYDPGSADYPTKITDNVAQFSVPVGSEPFSQLFIGFKTVAEHIESMHLPYHPVRQNSNSFVKTELVKNGLPAPRHPPVWPPGWNHILY